MVALDKATGKEIWRTPNPEQLAAVARFGHAGARSAASQQYLWARSTGRSAWRPRTASCSGTSRSSSTWRVAPSPLAVDDERVFMTGSYDAGSVMVRVQKGAGRLQHREGLRPRQHNEWNSEVHTPIVFQGHLFAVGKKKRGLFTCLDLDGKEVWTSEGKAAFGLGSFLLADGMFFILEGKTGMLRLVEAEHARRTRNCRAPRC